MIHYCSRQQVAVSIPEFSSLFLPTVSSFPRWPQVSSQFPFLWASSPNLWCSYCISLAKPINTVWVILHWLNKIKMYTWSESTSLTCGWFFTILALDANFKVDDVSSKTVGVTFQIMAVLALPPRDALRIWVSLLSRKLTKPSPSLSCLMTKDKADKLVLIAQPSRNLSPVAFVCDAFSDPAKSTVKLIQD